MEYYVYTASIDGEIVYVGSGKDDRYKHVCSGKSHSKELNFIVAKGIVPDVVIVQDGLAQDIARVVEQDYIDKYLPVFNKATAASKRTREEIAEISLIEKSANPTMEALKMSRYLYRVYQLDANRFSYLFTASFAFAMSDAEGNVRFTLKQYTDKASSYGSPPISISHTRIIKGIQIYELHLSDIQRVVNDISKYDKQAGFIKDRLYRYEVARATVLSYNEDYSI